MPSRRKTDRRRPADARTGETFETTSLSHSPVTNTRNPTTSDSKTGSTSKGAWISFLVLTAATFTVYANSFSGVLLFDDIPHIVENEKIHTLWPPWDLIATRRAVLNLTLAVNYAIHGLEVWGYHLVNIVVHWLAGLNLFGLVRRTLMTDTLRARWGEHARPVAFFAALLWLVHPLCTQSVTYIVQRGEALMGLFYLLTLYTLLRGATSRRPMGWYVACVIACALGMASKAVMVTAPVVALLFDRTFLTRGFADALRKRWWLHGGLMLSWGVLFALGIVQATFRTAPNPLAHVGFSHVGVTPIEYAATQPGVILHYLRLAFWPAGQCLDYLWPVARTPGAIVPASIVIGLLALGALVGTTRRTPAGFLGAAFLLILLPTSSFIPLKDLAFEHRMYLPLAAVVTLVVCTFCRVVLSVSLAARGWTAPAFRALGVIGAMTAVALGLVTVNRNRAYHAQETMWRDVADKCPHNHRAFIGIGAELQKKGLLEEAMQQYRHALSIEPAFADAWYNVGTLFEAKKLWGKAARAYERVIELAPQRLHVYEALARALSRAERFAEAARWYDRLADLDPNNARWSYEAGNAFLDSERYGEAIRRYRRATELEAGLVEAWINLGNALRRTGAKDAAIDAYLRAIDQDPGSYVAWLNLGFTRGDTGQTVQAIAAFEQAVSIQPDAAPAHAGLGWALKQAGRHQEAKMRFEEALRLDPANVMAQRGLAALDITDTPLDDQ